MNIYRQGNVLLVEIPALPDSAVADYSPGERIVIAEGETTVHAHALNSKYSTLYRVGDTMFVDAAIGARLTHEEHATIALTPGFYKVVLQKEYTKKAPAKQTDKSKALFDLYNDFDYTIPLD